MKLERITLACSSYQLIIPTHSTTEAGFLLLDSFEHSVQLVHPWSLRPGYVSIARLLAWLLFNAQSSQVYRLTQPPSHHGLNAA